MAAQDDFSRSFFEARMDDGDGQDEYLISPERYACIWRANPVAFRWAPAHTAWRESHRRTCLPRRSSADPKSHSRPYANEARRRAAGIEGPQRFWIIGIMRHQSPHTTMTHAFGDEAPEADRARREAVHTTLSATALSFMKIAEGPN